MIRQFDWERLLHQPSSEYIADAILEVGRTVDRLWRAVDEEAGYGPLANSLLGVENSLRTSYTLAAEMKEQNDS